MKEAGIHIPDSFHKLPEMFSVVYTQLVEEGVVVGTPEGESPPFAAIPAASVRAWPLEASATPAADVLGHFLRYQVHSSPRCCCSRAKSTALTSMTSSRLCSPGGSWHLLLLSALHLRVMSATEVQFAMQTAAARS